MKQFQLTKLPRRQFQPMKFHHLEFSEKFSLQEN